MIFRLIFLLLGSLWVFAIPSCAQQSGERYQSVSTTGFRAGHIYSMVDLIYKPHNAPMSLGGVTPRHGYYIGTYYGRRWSKWVGMRIDLIYQVKGMLSVYKGRTTLNGRYGYVGLTPSLTLHPLKKAIVMIGPEVNVLVERRQTWSAPAPFEAGITGRLSYSVGRIGLEVSYFQALTPCDHLDLFIQMPTRTEFVNKNVQLGLVYRLTN